ncbi:carbohydrate sulfotransferase 15-like [Oratosquilla oratoria]|uniref:carbohydrate sulfotransferase 15-like n=1 Tax=Oratosquilla oratoria TaxID=337810 RepID=UPI003F75F6AB
MVHNGLYSILNRDWLKVFPKEHVLVLQLEPYWKGLAGTLTKVYQHLGLRTMTQEEEPTVASAPFKNKQEE